MKLPNQLKYIILASTVLASSYTHAWATQINTASENGAYYQKFCPLLKSELDKAKFDYECVESEGSINNLNNVAIAPKQIGFSQLDIFAIENKISGDTQKFHKLRTDVVRECLFMVTKNKELQSYGDVALSARGLNFILPPKNSGHAGTFEFLQKIDPEGLGQAVSVVHAESTDKALDAVLDSNDDSFITLFVQFPDPDNTRFKSVTEKSGAFIPVIDRLILRETIEGEKVYFAEQTQITNAKWTEKSKNVVTACTPMVIFTGHAKHIKGETERKDHIDMIRTVEQLPVESLRPKQSFFATIWNQTKSLSATSVEKLMEVSDKARNATIPVVQKAKELTSKTIEASKPYLDKAKELGEQSLEKAKESAKEILDPKQ